MPSFLFEEVLTKRLAWNVASMGNLPEHKFVPHGARKFTAGAHRDFMESAHKTKLNRVHEVYDLLIVEPKKES